jgi:UDP-2-acetamido-2,6-beta-L-arabino-hexul-4-ose reductase
LKILVTGAEGFLGWHTRVRMRALTTHDVVSVSRDNWTDLSSLARGADAVMHIAGVNRGADRDVEQGNIDLAGDVGEAVSASGTVKRLIFANSIWAGSDSPYGAGKEAASALLAKHAESVDAQYVDVRLPNLFGEHGRPHYNSFVATFVDAVLSGHEPSVDDREIDILHAQSAAASLIGGLTGTENRHVQEVVSTTVAQVFAKLSHFHQIYTRGDFPELETQLDVDLFNTLRAAMFPQHYPSPLTVHSDGRGELVEAVRSHGGQGQTFVSTTVPGATRGDHFHLGKVERFIVVSGAGRISLRKVLSDQVVSFNVAGDEPVVVDMPTMWVHNITNTGDSDLVTLFWTHTLFDPANPDTYWEPVTTRAAS